MRNLKCACCGEAFRSKYILKYAPGHTPSHGDIVKSGHVARAVGTVDAQTFKKLLLKVKEDKGYTWKQMAERVGRSRGCIESYAYGKKGYISKDVADDILKRLSGEALAPTPRQAAEYSTLKHKDQIAHRNDTLKANRQNERKVKLARLRESLGH